ncbi:MAG: serine protease [Pseudomonadota bacterium]
MTLSLRLYLALALAAFIALLTPSPALADAADVDAAARGVVRVVIVGSQGVDGEDSVVPVSHGSGFAVSPTLIVTNAHVIREALQDDTLRIGVVPSESAGGAANGAFARAVSVSPRNDLALLEIAEGGLRLPALTIAGAISGDMGEVSAVGYPMNVDLAQGLNFDDIFNAQPPVKTRGFLSGERPSRQFDTLLHTAPIARGNSGGPLLDSCGRVVGVNSFGADSDGSDAEFYFAVSTQELLPFLRDNGLSPNTNALPCRSFDELNASELARFEAERAEARERIAAREAKEREAREAARMKALLTITEERDNAMALAFILLLLGGVSTYAAARFRLAPQSDADGGEAAIAQPRAILAAGLAGACFIAMALVWITRPGFSELEDRVAALLDAQQGEGEKGAVQPSLAGDGTLICTFIPERSRVTGARTDDVEFDWAADGCVNGRTQYGLVNGDWRRVFVSEEESLVSINSYDPQTRIFQTDRYLIGRAAMNAARKVRGSYRPPACGVTDAARLLGEQQAAVVADLPKRPNERLVYSCEATRPVGAAPAGN